MRSVLVFLEDVAYLNRIKAMLFDKTVEYIYAGTADEVVETVSNREIAVTVLMIESSALSGTELIEILNDKNPKMQIVLLFDEAETGKALEIHNTYHLGKMMCRDNSSLDELPKVIEEALYAYNEEDYLHDIDVDRRKKEDKYRQTMSDMTHILNDRMESYRNIQAILVDCVNGIRRINGGPLEKVSEERLNNYLSEVMSDYVHLFLLTEKLDPTLLTFLTAKYSDPEIGRYFKVINNVEHEIEEAVFEKIIFISTFLSGFFDLFFVNFRGKIELNEEASHYRLNVIYEVRPIGHVSDMADMVIPFNHKLVELLSTKAVWGRNDNVIQYKAFFRKPVKDKNEKA